MSTPQTHDIYEDDTPCEDSASVWAVLLASGSALLLGYLVGRVTYSWDLRDALRRIEESPDPITVSVRTL